MDPVLKMPSSQIFLVVFPYVGQHTAVIALQRRAELIRMLMLASARNTAALTQKIPIANMGIHMDSYLVHIKLEHPWNKVQVYLQNTHHT